MTYIGRGVPSLTNTRLVAGKGQFVDDREGSLALDRRV